MSQFEANMQDQLEGRIAKRKRAKRIRIAVIAVAVVAVVGAGGMFAFRMMGASAPKATSITTYNVQAVSTGNVDTTISGSGTLSPVSTETVTPSSSASVTVTAANYAVGDTVAEGDVLVTAESEYGYEYDYEAECDGVIIEIAAVGDGLTSGSQVALVMPTDGFTMNISVDEQDISKVKVGQSVAFAIDAVPGEYTGEVIAVSHNGTTSGSTTSYQITTKLNHVDGVYPGMSATAEIVIEASGEGLLVPVSAVHTSGDDSYVYLAPADATEGSEYAEEELDIATLTKAAVTTGMSDGTYILVSGEQIADGSLIVVTRLTSTLTGSESEGEESMGDVGAGGFPGGGMNFEDFDPSNMSQGGNMPQGGGMPNAGGN